MIRQNNNACLMIIAFTGGTQAVSRDGPPASSHRHSSRIDTIQHGTAGQRAALKTLTQHYAAKQPSQTSTSGEHYKLFTKQTTWNMLVKVSNVLQFKHPVYDTKALLHQTSLILLTAPCINIHITSNH